MMAVRRTLGIAACVAIGALSACIGGRSDEQANKEPPAEVKQYILDAVPSDLTELNINFDDKVHLVGVRIEPSGPVQPGKKVKLTYYWRVDKPLDAGWKLFTHVYDASGERLLNIDNVGPLRRWRRTDQAWPPGRWQAGKVYADTQSFTLPRKVKTATVQVATGIWRGKERVPIKSGPALKDDRALVATLETGVGKVQSTAAPRVEIPKLAAGSAPRIDGKLDDAVWSAAVATGAFVNVDTGEEDGSLPVQGNAKLAWDDEGLYLAFEVKDADITGGFDKDKRDQHLWTKDCVEVMIDPEGDGDNKDYYEIQVNPQNLVFDTRYDSYNRPMKLPDGPFGHQDWSSEVKSAVSVSGTIDDPKDKDEGYVVEMKVPWGPLGAHTGKPGSAPKPGTRFRVNLYAMQNNGGVAWSPILKQGNFHKASRFAYVTFIGEGETPAADVPPEPPPTTTPVVLDPGDLNKNRSSLTTEKKPVLPGYADPREKKVDPKQFQGATTEPQEKAKPQEKAEPKKAAEAKPKAPAPEPKAPAPAKAPEPAEPPAAAPAPEPASPELAPWPQQPSGSEGTATP